VKDYYSKGNTKALLALWRQQLKTKPNDIDLKNNLATVSMLLNNQDTKPYDLAHEVYAANPTNANYVTTYAFALFQQGKNDIAQKTINNSNRRNSKPPRFRVITA